MIARCIAGLSLFILLLCPARALFESSFERLCDQRCDCEVACPAPQWCTIDLVVKNDAVRRIIYPNDQPALQQTVLFSDAEPWPHQVACIVANETIWWRECPEACQTPDPIARLFEHPLGRVVLAIVVIIMAAGACLVPK